MTWFNIVMLVSVSAGQLLTLCDSAHIVHVTITLFRLMTIEIESQDITSFIQVVECLSLY